MRYRSTLTPTRAEDKERPGSPRCSLIDSAHGLLPWPRCRRILENPLARTPQASLHPSCIFWPNLCLALAGLFRPFGKHSETFAQKRRDGTGQVPQDLVSVSAVNG